MVSIDQNKCDRLVTCVANRSCPAKAFYQVGKTAFMRVERWAVDESKCVDCNLCVSLCPHQAISPGK